MAKSKSVQQQNREALDAILACATFWREKGLPYSLKEYLNSIEIDANRLIVISYMSGICFQEPFGMRFTILTQEQGFYDIEVVFNPEYTEITELIEFNNTTVHYNLSHQNRGIGKGLGCIALEALSMLNSHYASN